MRCSDSLTSIPPHFVAFVWQYRVCARYSLPGEGRAPSWVLGLFTGCPPGIERGEIRASQVPGGPPCMRAPLCDPDRPPASGQSWRERCCLPPGSRRRPRQFGSYEAESRGPHARCLRFAASVTRNTTQDSLPAGGQPLLGGISPAGPQRKVSSHIMAFPLSQACLAHEPSFHLGLGRPSLRLVLRRGIAYPWDLQALGRRPGNSSMLTSAATHRVATEHSSPVRD